MHMLKRFGASLALVALLAACALIPPIGVGDPLGLDGQVVPVQVGAAGLTSLADFSASASITNQEFPNQSTRGGPAPNTLTYPLTIADTLTVASFNGIYPERITISSLRLEAVISDDERETDADVLIESEVSFERAAACTDGSSSCSYSASEGFDTFELEVNGIESIIFGGPEPNRASGRMTVNGSSDPTLAAGSVLIFQLEVIGEAKASNF